MEVIQEKAKDIVGYVARGKLMTEAFQGENIDEPVRFPKDLGAEHPFDFEDIDTILENVGVMDAAVDKITDAIIGDFNIQIDDENSKAIIDDFIDNSNFIANIRPWVKEGVSKGNGFMEIDLDDEAIRVLLANTMYVRRNRKSKVLGYNQYIGNDKFNLTKNNVIPFKPNQIAHLTINKVPSKPYGRGLVWSNRVSTNNYASSETDQAKLVSRKAGFPYHIKVGQPGQAVASSVVDNVKTNLDYLNNSTNWVTDANVEIKVLDSSGVGDNLIKASEHNLEQMAMGMQIPLVMMGKGNIPEGLAKVQIEAFQRYIAALRVQIEDIIESQILRPILRKNNLDGKVNFVWELPGEEEKNNKLRVIMDTLKNPFMSPILKAGLEMEYAKILGLDDVINSLPDSKEAEKEAEDRIKDIEKDIEQPEVPGAKPTANQSAVIEVEEVAVETKHNLTESELDNMTLAEYVNLTEIPGFNYTDYLVKILLLLRTDKFDDLRALTESDIAEGLLPKRDINKLRVILKDGFKKNKTIREIENEISRSIDLKDRYKLVDGELKLTASAVVRPNMIARTETVRLANGGLKDLYNENNVEHYRYLAALDDRTSDICNQLNGQVFKTSDGTPGVNMPPMHVNCRSTIVGLVD